MCDSPSLANPLTRLYDLRAMAMVIASKWDRRAVGFSGFFSVREFYDLIFGMARGKMQVNHRSLDIRMSQQFLDGEDINPGHDQAGGEGVPERMNRARFDIDRPGRPVEYLPIPTAGI